MYDDELPFVTMGTFALGGAVFELQVVAIIGMAVIMGVLLAMRLRHRVFG